MNSANAGPDPSAPVSGWVDTDVSVRMRRGAGGAVRVDGVLRSAPLWLRWDGRTLWMVGSGASPVGEDHVRVHVDVGPGVVARVRSVAATVVYAARGAGTRWDTDIHLAEGARLDWRPEPVIVTRDACHTATTTVHAATGAALTFDEVLVLGRDAETAGTICSTLAVCTDDRPVLLTSIDTSLPAWSGPAGVHAAGVVAHRLKLGGVDSAVGAASPSRAVVLEPAPGCRLAVATADDVQAAKTSLGAVLID